MADRVKSAVYADSAWAGPGNRWPGICPAIHLRATTHGNRARIKFYEGEGTEARNETMKALDAPPHGARPELWYGRPKLRYGHPKLRDGRPKLRYGRPKLRDGRPELR